MAAGGVGAGGPCPGPSSPVQQRGGAAVGERGQETRLRGEEPPLLHPPEPVEQGSRKLGLINHEGGGDPEAVTDCLLLDTVQADCFRISAVPSGTMEGKETSPSHHSEDSSILDLPSVCDLAEHFLPPHSSENSEELFHSVDTFPSSPTGENSLPSAAPPSFSAGSSVKANVRCYPKVGLCETTEPNDAALSWVYEHDSAEDTSVRKCLDGFYKMYCKKRPDRMDPTYKAASQCLSQKISELANRDGTKYALRCLQMAQVVLNRDGCKIFPNHPTTTCFSKPTEGEVVLEDRKRTPGLSDDVLQFLLKQTRTEHSLNVPHEK